MISGDDVPHRLLYLRRVWGLGISPEDMSRAIETPDGVHFRHDSREQMWLEGWRQAWGCNELFYTRTLAENRVVDIPDQQPAEWFTAAGPDGVWDEKYRSWQVQISPVRNFRDRQTTLILRAEAAAARGLAAIYVVPVEGHWAASRGRILVVSPETFDSDAALIPVLDGV
ncbi:MAG: hypothetical protein Q7T17_09975 [Microbacterium sp.]|uniref:hypothetical protein n=1 Tax=Microbacterium sp. TaxID=51671 RepID=UPI00271A93CF|nr:hypothetical protein [Microbacterium sp.]MDO8383291.1 hypothetical protein [Microbacterium sp.]